MQSSWRVVVAVVWVCAPPTLLFSAQQPDVRRDATPAKSASSRFIFDLMPTAFQKSPHVEMTVFTEMTDAGRQLPPATPDRPAYYVSHAGGYQQLGHGAGEHPPAPEALERAMKNALETNGYFEAAPPKHLPSLVIIYHWGSHNRLDPQFAETDPAGAMKNLYERARLVGGEKFADDLLKAYVDEATLNSSGAASIMPVGAMEMMSPVHQLQEMSPRLRDLIEQASEDVYFVVASAYDYTSMARGERQLLWRTKMTVNTRGVSMTETLPPLIASGAPFFGRDMPEAEPLIRRIYREGRVELGEPTVVEFVDEPEKKETAKPGGNPSESGK